MSSRTRSSTDKHLIMQEGLNLLQETKSIMSQIKLSKDTAYFRTQPSEDDLQDFKEVADRTLEWARLHNKSHPDLAKQLRDVGLNVSVAIQNERNAMKDPEPISQTLKEIRAAATGPRQSGIVEVPVSSSSSSSFKGYQAALKAKGPPPSKKGKGKVKKGEPKGPKVKKVRKKVVAELTPQQEADAKKARERRQMYRERAATLQSALGQESMPFGMKGLAKQYKEDYVLNRKDGDRAVARVIRDKKTGQFKRLPSGAVVYKRGGIVGPSMNRAI